jgi:uncharacterized membrane protein
MSLLDEYNIEADPRFERIRQEVKVIFAYMAAMGILFFAIAVWGALSYDGSYEYILGFPTYMFFMTIEIIIFAIIGFIISLYYIEDTSLEAWRE